MSAQAGIWNSDGRPADRDLLQRFSHELTKHAADVENTCLDGSMGMLFRNFHTTVESSIVSQPYRSGRGFLITFDGRLDNRADLIAQLQDQAFGILNSDVQICAAAFERWGSECFSRLVGDWALCVWNPTANSLILAKDYMGLRHLYYQISNKTVLWCTYLEPLIRFSPAPLLLDDEYVAGYLGSYPKAHLTPYTQIRTVPPGLFVTIKNAEAAERRHWSFNPGMRTRYKTDTEYEEHFRHLLRQSVKRRLRANSKVLAELSGGIDSSSIVCLADNIIRRGEADTLRLDTVSLYDPDEPSGDERQHFKKVEEWRGRTGHHVNTAEYGNFFSISYDELIAVPGFPARIEGTRAALRELMRTQNYRVVLAGSGGDELLGGVPNALPQLADLLVQLRPLRLAKQLAAWSLIKRRPQFQLLFQTVALTLRVFSPRFMMMPARVPDWIEPQLVKRYRIDVTQHGPQGTYGYWLPSRRDYAQTLVATMRQFAYCPSHIFGFEERRYPYLDRDLIEYLLAIPASQILRPGQRRSLMRRALTGIVPSEILWRKTKGAVVRAPLLAFQNTWKDLEKLFTRPLSAELGYLNERRLLAGLRDAKAGSAPQLIGLLKALYLEVWLRSLREHHVLDSKLDIRPHAEILYATQNASTA